MDRDGSRREAGDGASPRAKLGYEPPRVTRLGSFTELTRVVKSGPVTDPGDGFQPSNGV
jgi:hypothetical protein